MNDSQFKRECQRCDAMLTETDPVCYNCGSDDDGDDEAWFQDIDNPLEIWDDCRDPIALFKDAEHAKRCVEEHSACSGMQNPELGLTECHKRLVAAIEMINGKGMDALLTLLFDALFALETGQYPEPVDDGCSPEHPGLD